MDSKNIIRTVIIGFALILMLGMLVAIISLKEFNFLRDNLARIVEINNKKTELALDMRELVRLRQLSLHKMLSMTDPFELDEEEQRFSSYANRYLEDRDVFLSLPLTDEEEEIAKELDAVTTIAHPLNRAAADILLDPKFTAEQRKAAIQLAQEKQTKLFAALNRMVRLQKRNNDELFVLSRKATDSSYLLVVMTSILLIVLGGAIAIVVTRFVKSNDAKQRLKNVQLTHAYKRAEAATQAKTEFLANMSHEIRTPMNGVMGMISLLAETPLSNEQRQYLDIANKSSASLLSLLNDILDISKVEAGKLKLEKADFDLISTLEDISILYSERARTKNINVISDINPELPRFVHGDQTRIEQVMRNIVSNAVKFTETGEVRLKASFIPRTEQSFILKMEVIDTGIGIPAEFADQIFQNFTQADSTVTRQYGGSGLGLAISRELTELMGGEIGYHANDEVGTVFWVNLPLEMTHDQTLVDERRNRFKGRTALVRIENKSTRIVLHNMFLAWGIDCCCDEKEEPKDPTGFDIFVVDDSSVALVREPSYSPKVKQVTICLCAYETVGECGVVEGVDVAICAPLRQASLFDRLCEVERNWAQTKILKGSEKGVAKLDLNAGQGRHVLVVDDNFFNQQVAMAMLKKMGFTVAVANDGQEALQQMEHHQFELILMDCHMPVMDGYAATRKIRELETEDHKNIIIAMTANVQSDNYDKCIECGMDDFLAKPITAAVLNETLARWI